MTIIHSDCVTAMNAMEPDSIDAICTDPPYGLEFMGKEWDKLAAPSGGASFAASGLSDGGVRIAAPSYTGSPNPNCQTCGGSLRGNDRAGGFTRCRCERPDFPNVWGRQAQAMQQWHQEWATAALRVAKPGAYLLAFGGTRTVHRMTVALEDAGWIIRDMLVWAYACLSDDTEILTDEGWVRYNSASEGQHAAAFDPSTGRIQWERIEAVHRYAHEGPMALVGPQLVTLNHRVVLDATEGLEQVPLPSDADVRGLLARLPDLDEGAGDPQQDVLARVPVGATAGATRQEAAGRAQGPDGGVRRVSQGLLATGRLAASSDSRGHVLKGVQWHPTLAGPALPTRDPGGLDRGIPGGLSAGDVRPEQPRLEGRRYRIQEAWELLGRALRAGPGLGASDGPQGRVRDGASAGDGWDVRLPDDQDGGREPRGPRPDEQCADEPDPLAGQPNPQAVRVGQVSTRDGEPDAVRVIEGYSGVVWCITVPSGAFVARRNGVVFVTGNSGFPKSKALLKPAWEPIVMARKPGPLRALDIDGCRIGIDPEQEGSNFDRAGKTYSGDAPRYQGIYAGGEVGGDPTSTFYRSGRWPANVVLTDAVLDEYSRFFLVPKASRSDREPVMPGMLEAKNEFVGPGSVDPDRPTVVSRRNVHPTVKPIELMRHLVRLVTPAGGTVLDPFLGSGTTALAAEQEGRQWVGIEREAEYVRIAEARLSGWQRGLGLDI
jgi:DNA modification methylase